MSVTSGVLHIIRPFNKPKCCFSTELLRFVPKHIPVQENDIKQLEEFVSSSSRLAILTGAGISTESGK